MGFGGASSPLAQLHRLLACAWELRMRGAQAFIAGRCVLMAVSVLVLLGMFFGGGGGCAGFPSSARVLLFQPFGAASSFIFSRTIKRPPRRTVCPYQISWLI